MIFISMVSLSLALKQRLGPTRNGNCLLSRKQKKKQNLPSFWNKVSHCPFSGSARAGSVL